MSPLIQAAAGSITAWLNCTALTSTRLCSKKAVWNFQALKTPAFIEAREFQTPFFWAIRTLPMNSKHYEELCRYFVAEQLGLPLSAIQSLRVPSPERQPESWHTNLGRYAHQIDLY